MCGFSHTPVLLDEVIEGLAIRADGIYADGTLGGGGHSLAIAERLSGEGRLIGIDRDEDAVNAAREVLSSYADRVSIVRGNYALTPEILKELGIDGIDGMLLDLGVSSYQFDTAERGFSYRLDAPLDMRMDRRDTLSAADIVNGYAIEEIARILREYGEERYAASIAAEIARARKIRPIETTYELSEIVKKALPASVRRKEGHPAKKTFQALRIEVNHELETLSDSLEPLIEILKPRGRLAVISFHSLEDRIVKKAFRTAEDPCICPKDFPVCVCGRKPKGRVITKRAITPMAEEIACNPRSKSAKLRIFEKA